MDISSHIAYIYTEGDLLLGNILSSLPRIQTDAIPTAAVGLSPGKKGVHLMYNEDWLDRLDPREIRAVLRHEAMHIAFYHILRSKGKESTPWNIATDMFINQNVSHLPPGGVELPADYDPGLSSDEYYDLVLEDPERWEDFQNSSGFDDHDTWKDICEDSETSRSLEEKVKEMVNRAADAGDKTARLAQSLTPPKPSMEWAVQIRKMFNPSEAEVYYRSNRFDRRRTYHDGSEMIPARVSRPSKPRIYVAVDTSASVDEKTLNKFAGEINNMQRYASITCMMFDTTVHKTFPWKKQMSSVEAVGFGGTDFQDIFNKVEEDRESDGVIILTDGWASMPTVKKNTKTLWVLTSDHNDQVKNWHGKSTILPF